MTSDTVMKAHDLIVALEKIAFMEGIKNLKLTFEATDEDFDIPKGAKLPIRIDVTLPQDVMRSMLIYHKNDLLTQLKKLGVSIA